MSLATLQAAASTNGSVNGPLAFVLLFTMVLVLPVSFALIWLYRRAVAKSMRASGNSPTEAGAINASQFPGAVAQGSPELRIIDVASTHPNGAAVAALFGELRQGPWHTAAVYIVAGGCYALILSVASLRSSQIELIPLRLLSVFWIYFWPVVLTVNLVAATSRPAKLATVSVYFLGLAVITVGGLVSNPEASWIGPLILWAISNVPAMLLVLVFANRRVRAVGPLVLVFLLLAVSGSQIVVMLLISSDALTRVLANLAYIAGLGSHRAIFGALLLGFFIVWPLGWLVLRVIRRLYERKRISDQSITLDAIFLLFGYVISLMLTSQGPIWIFSGLVAFLGYKSVAWAGFKILPSKTLPAPRLLLLRVFALGKRSEQLFRALANHWRHVGSIELIAGPDLATSTLEPHEFLDFLAGKLARRFIDGPEALEQRILEMDTKPDQDGRFRVNDFFCREDTWKRVLSRLVKESDVVLMDLRGFSVQNRGCLFEVNELINVAPLGQVVFVIDETTDEPFLLENARQSWAHMLPASPNRRSPSGQLQLFRFTGGYYGGLRKLLRAVSNAATKSSNPAVTP